MAAFAFDFLLVLAIVYGTQYVLRFLEDYQIPVVAIEILAGLVFGSVLGLITPATAGYDFLVTLAAFGLLLIMFEAGFELDPRRIIDEPVTVGSIGVLTFLLPFLAGAGLGRYLGLGLFASFLVGVTVSTTSLGLVEPLLGDFDLLDSEQGQLILSITGLNDVLSIVALAYGVALTGSQPLFGAGAVTAVLVLFFVVIPVFFLEDLSRIAPEQLARAPVKTGVLLTVFLGFLTHLLGIHAVLGGFFAGLLLDEVTTESPEGLMGLSVLNTSDVESAMQPVVVVSASAFFFYVGLNFDVGALFDAGVRLLGLVILIGVGSKSLSALVGGYVMGIGRKTTWLLAATIPGRLSISVAAAEIGRANGLISPELYNAFIILSTFSVFVTVAAFRLLMRTVSAESGEEALEASESDA